MCRPEESSFGEPGVKRQAGAGCSCSGTAVMGRSMESMSCQGSPGSVVVFVFASAMDTRSTRLLRALSKRAGELRAEEGYKETAPTDVSQLKRGGS